MDLQGVLFLSMFVLIPAVLLLLVRPVARWVFFLLGVAVLAAFELFGGPSGPDNPELIWPLIALGVAAGALVVEAIAWPIRRRRARSLRE